MLLVVDAQEGPMPQTRFVLKKSLELGLKPIVVINKIDKPAADAKRVHDEVFELLWNLVQMTNSLSSQLYAIGREGVAMKELDDERKDQRRFLILFLKRFQSNWRYCKSHLWRKAFNLAYDNFLGRMAICRVRRCSKGWKKRLR